MVSISGGGTGIGVLSPDYMHRAKTHKKKSHCPPKPTLSHGATGVGVLAPSQKKGALLEGAEQVDGRSTAVERLTQQGLVVHPEEGLFGLRGSSQDDVNHKLSTFRIVVTFVCIDYKAPRMVKSKPGPPHKGKLSWNQALKNGTTPIPPPCGVCRANTTRIPGRAGRAARPPSTRKSGI